MKVKRIMEVPADKGEKTERGDGGEEKGRRVLEINRGGGGGGGGGKGGGGGGGDTQKLSILRR